MKQNELKRQRFLDNYHNSLLYNISVYEVVEENQKFFLPSLISKIVVTKPFRYVIM